MLTAFLLALGQLADRRVMRVLVRSLAVTLALFAVITAGGWWQLDRLPANSGLPERLVLGGSIFGLLTVPFVNLLVPFLGAAMATHLVHRKGASPHAA